jgi:hypothetical protein
MVFSPCAHIIHEPAVLSILNLKKWRDWIVKLCDWMIVLSFGYQRNLLDNSTIFMDSRTIQTDCSTIFLAIKAICWITVLFYGYLNRADGWWCYLFGYQVYSAG